MFFLSHLFCRRVAPASLYKRRRPAVFRPGGAAFLTNRLRLLAAVLPLLVGHAAGSLAGGLARGLALAAATVGSALLQGSTIESFDVSHGYPSILLS